MSSEVNSSKAVIGGPEVDDFEDLDKTAVLDESAGLDRDFELDEADDAFEKTVALGVEDAVTDNVGDVSVEINVEELVADIEASSDKDASRKMEVRRRLEEIAEDRSFDDTYALELDKESD